MCLFLIVIQTILIDRLFQHTPRSLKIHIAPHLRISLMNCLLFCHYPEKVPLNSLFFVVFFFPHRCYHLYNFTLVQRQKTPFIKSNDRLKIWSLILMHYWIVFLCCYKQVTGPL